MPFIVGGLNVDLSQVGANGIPDLTLITALAIVGKFAGTFVAARTQGMANRRSAALATLMNTRGLAEIVVLGIGLEIGVIDRAIYSLMMVTAVITTAMSGPLLGLVTESADEETYQPRPAVKVPVDQQ